MVLKNELKRKLEKEFSASWNKKIMKNVNFSFEFNFYISFKHWKQVTKLAI